MTNQRILEVEKPLKELEEKISALREIDLDGKVNLSREIRALEHKVELLKKEIYSNLSPWDRVMIARHPLRPNTLDYIKNLSAGHFELRGDRRFSDDPAVVACLARVFGQTVVMIGHQKGKDTKENLRRNFGMPSPDGLRKAHRAMELAARFGFPVITMIDTPGAYPGMEAEERGQSEAIASNLAYMFELPVPVISVVIGEGGSGGALALGVSDCIVMLENSIYSVISPEGAASILWRDASRAAEAARKLKITAGDLKKLGIVDAVVPEPPGGVHNDPDFVYLQLQQTLGDALGALESVDGATLLRRRYEKYRKIGADFIRE